MIIKPFDFRTEWPQFCGLYQKVFDGVVDKAYVDWKFLLNPFGEACGLGAWHEDNLVGFVAVWPLHFILNGKEITASAGGDTMVDKEFRKQGLFRKMTLQLLEEMTKRGWLFRYSAPGVMSYPGYIKTLHHHLVGLLPYWIKIHPARILRVKLFGLSDKTITSSFEYRYKRLTVKIIDNFDQRFDKLWQETNELFNLSVMANSSYFNWRYFQNPFLAYLILSCEDEQGPCGFAVIRGGNLVELRSGRNPDIYDALLSASDKIWKITGQDMNHAWFLSDTLLESALKKNGWYNYKYKIRPFGLYKEQPLICYVNADSEVTTAVNDCKTWRFSMGDIDCM